MKKILVICTGNACRSQIAHGFLNDLAKDQYEIFSAGTHPTRVHPAAIKVMNEIDIDISTHTSDPIDDYIDKGIDIVITVCDSANKLCPTFPGEVERIHWSISDPYINWSDEEQFLPTYRNARNIIQEKIQWFLKEKRTTN